ncbi:MAG: PfkB family carbohydrate kinase [Bryobacteraceae bacterium]|jgi:D-beta-D-heptose 7-phosphate kinase/D-beta-D-heptose 1-phosphate adenosyltransferase
MGNPRLHQIVERLGAGRILVAGDLMLDEFIWGRVSRISPEAPVPVVEVTSESYYPGGAANVARNVRDLGAEVRVTGTAGADPQGSRLLELLAAARIDTAAVLRDPSFSTTVKTRIIAGHQQVTRVDRERRATLDAAQTEFILAQIEQAIDAVDAVIVADYGKGFLTQPLADRIGRKMRAAGKILAVDPHPHTSLVWQDATIVKPNRREAFLEAGVAPSVPVEPPLEDRPLLEAARRLQTLWRPKSLLITLGAQGMLLLEEQAPPRHLPAYARDVFDVSGAGDTAISVLALALAAGATPGEAAELANHASAIVVGKLGTATVTAAELAGSLARS